MRRLLPDSIAGRTILVLLAGLMLSHIASIATYYSDRADALTNLGGGQIAERIATISQLIETTQPGERARIVEAVNSTTLRLAWSQRSNIAENTERSWRTQLMARMLRFHLGNIGDDRLRVSHADAASAGFAPSDAMLAESMRVGMPKMMHAHMRFIAGGEALGRGLQVSLRLSDGSWLNFATPFTGSVPFWSLRFVLSLAVMAVAVIALSVWVVRRLTAPLAIFARAAERLGVDVNAPPLLESGPREVRQATRAFNEMQRRIRRFIDDRTQMVAAISHDLRTPLTRLRLRAEFVEDAEHQDKMLHDIDEMETMIASVLSFARDAAADEPHELIDVVALLQSVCDDAADAGGQVALEAAGQTTLFGRSMALRRAMTNLIDNAVKYGERARVMLEVNDAWITIRVDDDGPGIPDGKAERVFEPFYRLETSRSRETGGVGLGLCVARTIIRAHGGDIELANRPEGGLRVSVSLPGQRAA